MSVLRFLSACAAATLPLLFLSCANQLPPEGGPIDLVPPKIVSTYPPVNSLRVRDQKIDLEFDKYVDHRSVEESIFISPYVGELEFDWSGKEVEVTFTEKLRPNRTYVVNVGTDVVDLNNRNHMAQAFTLAFSTGDDIDHGAIRGRVYPRKPTDPPDGVMIFAYQLVDLDPDTLNPRTMKPDYITQTGKNGEFYLQHLAFGAYRIVAVRDEFRNLLYDPEADDFAVPSRAMVLSPKDTMADHVNLQLAREDTTRPRLVKAEARDIHHVLLEFSEPVDTSTSVPLEIAIVDTLSGIRLSTKALYPNLPKLNSFTVVTDRQDSTKTYDVTVEKAFDLVGLPMNPSANSLVFLGGSATDSSAPRLTSIGISDSARHIPLDPTVEFRFSDALQRESLENAFVLKDTTGGFVPLSLVWRNDAAFGVHGQRVLSSKSWYTLTFVLHGVKDWSGKSFRDSVKVVHFETLDAEVLSSIEGTIVDRDTADRIGTVIVAADAVDVKEPKSFMTTATRDGAFVFSDIEEGRYILHAFRDRNANGTYDAGKPFPFQKSERFSYAPDTLKVRARWPLEGVRIDLK